MEQTKWKDAEAAGKGQTAGSGQFCRKCDAWYGQLGLEPTPQLFVEHLVEVFDAIRRVLRPDGVIWLNLGDSYANDAKWGGKTGGKHAEGLHGEPVGRARRHSGLKGKDLAGVPWRVAFGLQDAGWWLRSDIVWAKKNCMPESVRDRPTRAHEYIFLLAKSQSYFYDADAIREGWADERQGASGNKDTLLEYRQEGKSNQRPAEAPMSPGRNKRTVWNVNPRPYPGAHFATWPEKLVEPMVKAGTSQHGCCSKCRAPYQRVTEVVGEVKNKWGTASDEVINSRFDTMTGGKDMPGIRQGIQKVRATTGWEPTCECEGADVVKCLVLDPFSGSATTGAVALRLGRDYIGTDLQAEYLDLAEARLTKRKPPAKPTDDEPDLIGDLFG